MSLSALDPTTLSTLAPFLDALPFYVILVNEDHEILAANKAVTSQLDLEPEALIGCHCPLAVHGHDGVYPGCPLEQSMEQGGELVEKEFYDEEAGIWVESMIYPVQQPEPGGKRVFLHFVRDITERKRMEQVAISRERLARVGELSAGIAHTMRNPLHGLLNSVSHLRKRLGAEDQEAGEILEWMSEGLTRMETTTRRLLTLTREAPLQKQEVKLAEVVEEALTLVGQHLQGDGPALEYSLTDLPSLMVDPDRMSEVVVNLLDNAVDACAEEGAINVRTRPGKSGGAQQILEVEDTGPGIPQDIQEKVFDPFFTTKAIGEGSGLGLAIAWRVVNEHGGDVEIQSDEGRGTLIRVTLPAR